MSNYPHYLQRLQDATRKFWDKPALNTIGGDSFTYAQMATDIARFHIVFEKAGFKKGDKIALCANNGAKWGFAYLAVNTYAPFSPTPPAGQRWIRRRCPPSRWSLT